MRWISWLWTWRYPDWWTRGVLRFLEATDLLKPMERLVAWLNRILTRGKT